MRAYELREDSDTPSLVDKPAPSLGPGQVPSLDYRDLLAARENYGVVPNAH